MAFGLNYPGTTKGRFRVIYILPKFVGTCWKIYGWLWTTDHQQKVDNLPAHVGYSKQLSTCMLMDQI
jgi:hypothetical protein